MLSKYLLYAAPDLFYSFYVNYVAADFAGRYIWTHGRNALRHVCRILPYYTTHVSQSRRTSVQCLPNGEFVGRTKPVSGAVRVSHPAAVKIRY